MDNFKAFYAKVLTDEAFKAEVEKILGDIALENATDEQISQLCELVKAKGIDISVEDFKESLNMAEKESEQLTDEQLDMVAGGSESDRITGTIIGKIFNTVIKALAHCFVGDSKISTPNGFKAAQDIKLGDEVYTFDVEDKKIVGKVLEVHATANIKVVEVEFSNGATWKAAPVQWFYCGNDDYACVTDTKGKSALTEDGSKAKVVKITDNGETANVYDFVIEGENLFIVNGVVAEGYTGD